MPKVNRYSCHCSIIVTAIVTAMLTVIVTVQTNSITNPTQVGYLLIIGGGGGALANISVYHRLVSSYGFMTIFLNPVVTHVCCTLGEINLV